VGHRLYRTEVPTWLSTTNPTRSIISLLRLLIILRTGGLRRVQQNTPSLTVYILKGLHSRRLTAALQ